MFRPRSLPGSPHSSIAITLFTAAVGCTAAFVGCTPASTEARHGSADAGADSPSGSPDGGSLSDGSDGAGPSGSAFATALNVIRNGGTLPAKGKNGPVTVKVNPDGSRSATIPGKVAGVDRLDIEWTSSTSFSVTADVNGDGKIDEQRNVTTSNGLTTDVWQLDRSLSGSFDWRSTTTLDETTLTSVLEEILPFATAFTTTATYSASALQQSAGCVPPQMTGSTCDPTGGNAVPPTPKYCMQPPPPAPPCTENCCGNDGQLTLDSEPVAGTRGNSGAKLFSSGSWFLRSS
jgi:hypothetical protein